MERIVSSNIIKFRENKFFHTRDSVVVEEPLEIRLSFRKNGVLCQKSIAVTMRTPGHDEDLALGFLFTEGVISDMSQIKTIIHAKTRLQKAGDNLIIVEINESKQSDIRIPDRNFFISSSCGVCGKASVEAVHTKGLYELAENQPRVSTSVIQILPDILLQHQQVFNSTGGLHGVSLFTTSGQMLLTREDVGRHNALDKLVGSCMRNGHLPLSEHILLVSGRAGFELVQKAVMAGIPVMAAVGAPSSLAIDLAEECGMTLIGFLRKEHFNVYSNPGRLY